MKIAFVDVNDPMDPLTWSGIPSRMVAGLSRYADIEVIGNLGWGIRPIYGGHKIYYKLAGKRFEEHRAALPLRLFAHRIRHALPCDTDAVIAPGSIPVALLELDKPIAFWSDSCFASMPGYYDTFSMLCSRSLLEGQTQERAALSHCSLAIYASDWAAETCRRHYPETASKVCVVPFGANFDPHYDGSAARRLVEGKRADECHLLFVGVDWVRKGGPTALAAAQIMTARGLPTKLTIVGCDPFGASGAPPNVEVTGFLSRHLPQGRTRLAELLRASHFLVLPSQAEAYGIVLCEAAAFALPSVASRTGGIPTIVDDEVTGRLLSDHADGREYADALAALFWDQQRYRALALAAFEKYRTRLNWNVACKSVIDRITEML